MVERLASAISHVARAMVQRLNAASKHLPPRVTANAVRVSTRASTAAETATAATTATATATEATSTAASTAEAAHLLNLVRNLLLGLAKNANQLSRRLRVLGREVRVRRTRAAGTTGTADLVNVVLRVGGEVVVDDCDWIERRQMRGSVKWRLAKGGNPKGGAATYHTKCP